MAPKRAQLVAGRYVWEEIGPLFKGRGKRWAAIAYLGVDAPDMLPLRRNDVLICSADRSSLRAGMTSALALERLVDKGVTVYSLQGLHAKMMASADLAVVGSANASQSSANLYEAVVVHRDPVLISEVMDAVGGLLAIATRLDEEAVRQAKGVPVRRPGFVPRPASEPELVPNPLKRVGLWRIERGDRDEEIEAVAEREVRRQRSVLRLGGKFNVGWGLHDPGDSFQGDVVLWLEEDRVRVATVLTADVGTKGYFSFITDDRWIPQGDLFSAFKREGLSPPRENNWIRHRRRKEVAMAAFGLWPPTVSEGATTG